MVMDASRYTRPSILIYRSNLLPLSETFVLSQPEAFEHFTPHFVGCSRVDGLSLPEGRYHVVDGAGIWGSTRKTMYRLFGLAPRLTHTLHCLKPALVHAHFGLDSVPALQLARRLGIPLVVTFHGFDATMKDGYAREHSYDYRRYLRWRDTIQKEASLFVAVSEFLRERLIQQGFPSSKIAVHYVGVDTSFFTPDLNVSRSPMVLFAGRLVDSKGCDYLIQAMARVQRDIPDTSLVVIGNGPLRDHLEQMASGYLRNYQFLGARNQIEIRHWMNRAKVFSVPSFTTSTGASEGFGLALTEAQAMGLPVASFATGGIPEAVEHDVTGLLAKERDVEGLAKNITCLLTDDFLWKQFSLAARQRTRECFDLKKQTGKLEHMYGRLLMHQPVTTLPDSPSVHLHT